MVMNSVFVENRDEHLVVIHADDEILLDYEVFRILYPCDFGSQSRVWDPSVDYVCVLALMIRQLVSGFKPFLPCNRSMSHSVGP
jgi:hypothetical protein